MITIIDYIGAALVVCIFLFCGFCVLWFLVGLLRIWVFTSETRGMTAKELKKAEQELCKHPNTVYTDKHPDYPWTCCDCGKSV